MAKITEMSNQILVGSKHQMNCGINKQHNHQEIMSLCLNATDSKVLSADMGYYQRQKIEEMIKL